MFAPFQALSFAQIIGRPKRPQIRIMEARVLVFWLRQIESATRNDVIDMNLAAQESGPIHRWNKLLL